MRAIVAALVLVCGCSNADGEADGDGTSSSDGSDAGSSSDGGCIVSDDCDDVEVCYSGTCSHALDHTYSFSVVSFSGCMVDGWGDAEIYFRAYVNDAMVLRSLEHTCPAGWPDESVSIDPNDVLELEFWELDAFVDDQLTTFCFDETGTCDLVPPSLLHEETVVVSWGDGLTAELDFVLQYE